MFSLLRFIVAISRETFVNENYARTSVTVPTASFILASVSIDIGFSYTSYIVS